MEIKRAAEFGDNIREKLGELYVNAFYDNVFKYFSRNKTKLAKTFACGFLLEYFYVAIMDNEIVGMAACMGKDEVCIKLNLKTIIKYMGLFKGLILNYWLKQFLKGFPKLKEEKTALIECLSIDTKHLRKGIASTLVKTLITLTEYNNYILEVIGTNEKAIKLYNKLGFKVVYLIPYFPRIYFGMKYTKEENNCKNNTQANNAYRGNVNGDLP
jgi:ribosomal protein S18 acetylase RimI-like enzyme